MSSLVQYVDIFVYRSVSTRTFIPRNELTNTHGSILRQSLTLSETNNASYVYCCIVPGASTMSIENDLNPSHYAVLGLNFTASFNDIKASYHKLALQYHPDKVSSASAAVIAEMSSKFQRVQQAWSVLQEETSRQVYDNKLQAFENKANLAHYTISLEDLDVVNEEEGAEVYQYACRCSNDIVIAAAQLEEGQEDFPCAYCSLVYRVSLE